MPEPQVETVEETLSADEIGILQTLIYFGIFKYPLKPSEIHQYAPIPMSPMVIVPSLNFLANSGLLFQLGNYYAIKNEPEWVERREKESNLVAKTLKKAYWHSNLISRCPFVRTVCISGTLAKGFIDKERGVEYFIITEPERLWIARMLLLAFKKTALLNSKKHFGINYLVDINHLEIPDQNLYTATEIESLIPTYGVETFVKFKEKNTWSKSFRPNMKAIDVDAVSPKKHFLFKSVFEFIFSNALGNALDTLVMKMTINLWKKKVTHFNREFFEQPLTSHKYVAKYRPLNTQKLVLEAMDEGQKGFDKAHGLKLQSG